MKLTGNEISERVGRGEIGIAPFDPDQVSPNSYDLRLAPVLEYYTEPVLDPTRANPTAAIAIPDEGLVLPAGSFFIGRSVERISTRQFLGFVHAKSGIARLGLHVHVTADLIATGHDDVVEFHLSPAVDVRVMPTMRIAQMSFEVPVGEIVPPRLSVRPRPADGKAPSAPYIIGPDDGIGR